MKPLGAVAVRVAVLLAPLSTTVNVLFAGPVVMVTVVVPVPTAPKPKLVVLLNVSPIAMPEELLNELPYASLGTLIVNRRGVLRHRDRAGAVVGERDAGRVDEIVAVPVRLGEVAVAVRLFEPAAKRVADSVVVLTPLVNETVLVG